MVGPSDETSGRVTSMLPATSVVPLVGVITTPAARAEPLPPSCRPYACRMYPPPTGPDLTAEQCQELDDTFLSSDPYGYFSARIRMMLWWAESDVDSHKHALAVMSRDVVESVEGYAANRRVVSVVVVEVEPAGQRQASFGL